VLPEIREKDVAAVSQPKRFKLIVGGHTEKNTVGIPALGAGDNGDKL